MDGSMPKRYAHAPNTLPGVVRHYKTNQRCQFIINKQFNRGVIVLATMTPREGSIKGKSPREDVLARSQNSAGTTNPRMDQDY